jgi:hypothetical protein
MCGSGKRFEGAVWVSVCAVVLLCAATRALSGAKVAGCALLRQDLAVGTNPIAVVIADVNGDGLPDIVTANARSQTLSVLLRRPGTLYQRLADKALTGAPRALAAPSAWVPT